MQNIIFIAPPAAGKGTLSKRLQDDFAYTHISTGDMLREAINAHTPLGDIVNNIMAKGELVSDEIVINLISEKLVSSKGKPFILDGFPRTLKQAEKLDELLNSLNTEYLTIYLDLPKEEALRRIVGRLTCSCGKTYNTLIANLKPQKEGICDVCGKTLLKREDDNEESFLIRYTNYMKNTQPIIDYYLKNNHLIKVDANKDSNLVYDDILRLLNDKY